MDSSMDVSTLCRSCMVEIASWECEDVDQKTMDMFSFCTNIEIPKDDNLPKHFCYNCTVLLESSYAYIRTARRVNGKLKKLVQNGCTNFVDTFLNKTNNVSPITFNEKDKKVDDILQNYVEPLVVKEELIYVEDLKKENAVKQEYDDLFDDDDDICLSEFKSENVENGMKVETDLNNKDSNIESAVPTEPINDNDMTVLNSKICNICNKEFSSNGWLSRHMKSFHTPKGLKKKKKVGEKIKRKKIEQTNEVQEEQPKEDLPEIKCRVCDKKFKSKQSRTKHLNEEHSNTVDGQRVFLCPYCPKTFTKYANMYYHTTSHPDLAKHPCETCGKPYRTPKELEQHVRTHLKDRPFACDKCDMRFKIKGILVTHLKWHEGVRPFLCSICGRSFLQSGNLDSHMRVHTGERPFACTQCTFRSTSRVSLKRHELRHKGERPYPCTYCPKRFYESCSLNRHLRCHTRERPYRCPYCSREFFDSGKRRRHFIMTHKMAPEEIPPMDKSGAPVERTARNLSKIQRAHPWTMSA